MRCGYCDEVFDDATPHYCVAGRDWIVADNKYLRAEIARLTAEVARINAENRRLTDEALTDIEILEAAERERDEARAEVARLTSSNEAHRKAEVAASNEIERLREIVNQQNMRLASWPFAETERLREEHTTAMSHLAFALNENQRLKFRDANVRRAASDVCDAAMRWEKCQHGSELLQMIRNVESTVRSLSDAIGRKPR